MKKPKSKKALTVDSVAGPSNPSAVKQEGTIESPIALNSDGEEEKVGQKRKRYITVVEGGKKRKVVDVVRAPIHVFTLTVWRLE
jgi:hypothetical protein